MWEHPMLPVNSSIWSIPHKNSDTTYRLLFQKQKAHDDNVYITSNCSIFKQTRDLQWLLKRKYHLHVFFFFNRLNICTELLHLASTFNTNYWSYIPCRINPKELNPEELRPKSLYLFKNFENFLLISMDFVLSLVS